MRREVGRPAEFTAISEQIAAGSEKICEARPAAAAGPFARAARLLEKGPICKPSTQPDTSRLTGRIR